MSSDSENSSSEQSNTRKRKRDSDEDEEGHGSTTSTANARTKEDDAATAVLRPTKRKYTRRAKLSSAHAAPKGVDGNNNPSSPFLAQTTSFYLPLAPIAQGSPLEGMCAEHFSPMLLSYVPSFKGVVLSYSNPRFSTSAAGPTADGDGSDGPAQEQAMAKSIAEYAAAHTWLTADFTLLKPSRYAWIEGYVTVQSRTHLGLVCWNLFNASIERKRMPEGWRWVTDAGAAAPFSGKKRGKKTKKAKNAEDQDEDAEEAAATDADDDEDKDAADDTDAKNRGRRDTAHGVEGYWTDSDGDKVDGMLKFRVRDLETTPSFGKENGFVAIEGSLLDDNAEFKMDRREAISAGKAKAAAQRAAAKAQAEGES